MIFQILLVSPHYSVEFYKIELCLHQLFGYLEMYLYAKKNVRISAFPLFSGFQNNELVA